MYNWHKSKLDALAKGRIASYRVLSGFPEVTEACFRSAAQIYFPQQRFEISITKESESPSASWVNIGLGVSHGV